MSQLDESEPLTTLDVWQLRQLFKRRILSLQDQLIPQLSNIVHEADMMGSEGRCRKCRWFGSCSANPNIPTQHKVMSKGGENFNAAGKGTP
jgi:hypothetical protein